MSFIQLKVIKYEEKKYVIHSQGNEKGKMN